jgi:hypothetical protein
MIKKIISIFLFALIVGTASFFIMNIEEEISPFVSLEEYVSREAKLGGVDVKLYVANTDEKMSKGLSNVEKLEENEGMIFIYPDEGEREFWMKDMNFPLDILWFNSKSELVHKEENVLPESYPQVYGRGIEAQYVMEFNAGFVERSGIE